MPLGGTSSVYEHLAPSLRARARGAEEDLKVRELMQMDGFVVAEKTRHVLLPHGLSWSWKTG